MRLLDPRKPVVVRRDGSWHDGDLRAWRRDLDGRRGYVRCAVSPGIRYLEWIAAERMREALLPPAVPLACDDSPTSALFLASHANR